MTEPTIQCTILDPLLLTRLYYFYMQVDIHTPQFKIETSSLCLNKETGWKNQKTVLLKCEFDGGNGKCNEGGELGKGEGLIYYIFSLHFSYDIMLECWMEHPQDRPTFSQLRNKFSRLLLSASGSNYIILEVDESKIYYTIEEEEEEEEKFGKEEGRNSFAVDSREGIKKDNAGNKPIWGKQSHTVTASTSKVSHTTIKDGKNSRASCIPNLSYDGSSPTTHHEFEACYSHFQNQDSLDSQASPTEDTTLGVPHFCSPDTITMLKGKGASFLSRSAKRLSSQYATGDNNIDSYVNNLRDGQILDEGEGDPVRLGSIVGLSLMVDLSIHPREDKSGEEDVTIL